MKKLFLTLTLGLTLFSSCKKEDTQPNSCNCGIITDIVEIPQDTPAESFKMIMVNNNCSGKDMNFKVPFNDTNTVNNEWCGSEYTW